MKSFLKIFGVVAMIALLFVGCDTGSSNKGGDVDPPEPPPIEDLEKGTSLVNSPAMTLGAAKMKSFSTKAWAIGGEREFSGTFDLSGAKDTDVFTLLLNLAEGSKKAAITLAYLTGDEFDDYVDLYEAWEKTVADAKKINDDDVVPSTKILSFAHEFLALIEDNDDETSYNALVGFSDVFAVEEALEDFQEYLLDEFEIEDESGLQELLGGSADKAVTNIFKALVEASGSSYTSTMLGSYEEAAYEKLLTDFEEKVIGAEDVSKSLAGVLAKAQEELVEANDEVALALEERDGSITYVAYDPTTPLFTEVEESAIFVKVTAEAGTPSQVYLFTITD
jgi:hypothetical protein